MKYNLSHLTQGDNPPLGPIQDDEALLLFSIIRVCGFKRVLEFGFGAGDSARNFLEAVGTDGHVYSVDINPLGTIAPNHTFIRNHCGLITQSDIGERVDMIFFDCHHPGQMDALSNLSVDERTMLALHDTGIHAEKNTGEAIEHGGGWVHQPVEWNMRFALENQGWRRIDFGGFPNLPMRHGITILQKS